MIRFMIKCALFVIFVLVIISLFAPRTQNSDVQPSSSPIEGTSAVDAIIALKNTVGDLSGFCDRNEKTCETGRSFIGTLGIRMREGARITYQYLFGAQDEAALQKNITANSRRDNTEVVASPDETTSQRPTKIR